MFNCERDYFSEPGRCIHPNFKREAERVFVRRVQNQLVVVRAVIKAAAAPAAERGGQRPQTRKTGAADPEERQGAGGVRRHRAAEAAAGADGALLNVRAAPEHVAAIQGEEDRVHGQIQLLPVKAQTARADTEADFKIRTRQASAQGAG